MPKLSLQIPTFLNIRIGGPKSIKGFNALLDTGSTYVVVSWEDAIELGYEPWRSPEVQVGTVGGRINAPVVVLDYVEMLGFRVERVEALVKDISEIGINSLIGWSLLKHFKTLLDPKHGILEIEDP